MNGWAPVAFVGLLLLFVWALVAYWYTYDRDRKIEPHWIDLLLYLLVGWVGGLWPAFLTATFWHRSRRRRDAGQTGGRKTATPSGGRQRSGPVRDRGARDDRA
jgi:hypothetical protein